MKNRIFAAGNSGVARLVAALFLVCSVAVAAQNSSEGQIPLAAEFSEWSAPVNVGSPVNSEIEDQGAFISKDELSLFFISTRPGGFGAHDLYVSHRETVDGPWGPPQNLGPTINGPFSEASPTLSEGAHVLYFHSNRPGGFGGNDLWMSVRIDKRDDQGWQAPVNLGPEINSAGNERSVTIFEDDETETMTIYFDSDKPGGVGSVDIYVTTLDENGEFTPAVLVPELSTLFLDILPMIRRDGLEIFFDSNRPGGSGNRDLWVSTRASTSEPWTLPVNLGPTVNSAALDARPGLSWDGTSLYFHSARSGGLGSFDIYVSTRTKLHGNSFCKLLNRLALDLAVYCGFRKF